jgi:putative CocE/NonD family hydrolase
VFENVRLLHDQRVPVRDGVHLSADVYLPRGGGAVPAILTRTPYESTSRAFVEWAVSWAEQGYAAVVQDVRGRYESEGAFYPYRDEGADGCDTLDWLAGQSWCTGRIGMWGRSYGGLVQWHAVAAGARHLAALAPQVVPDDYFSDYHYLGGAFQLGLLLTGTLLWTTNTEIVMGSRSAAVFNRLSTYAHLPLIGIDEHVLGRRIDFWRDWLEHGTDDDYWKSLGTVGRLGGVTVPTFQQTGWYDPYTRGAFRSWSALRDGAPDPAAHTVTIGPWSHGEPEGTTLGDRDFGARSLVDLRERERSWFDHWLKDGPDRRGAPAGGGPLSLFVMGDDEWRDSAEWPPPGVEHVSYFLASGGRANSLVGDGTLGIEPGGSSDADGYLYDPEDPVLSVGGVNSIDEPTRTAEVPVRAGAVDQRPLERRDDVLVYTSAALERSLEVTGPVELILYAASSGRDTDFVAKLVDVEPSGAALVVTEGILRARFRNSMERPELLEPNEIQRYRIELFPTSAVFKAGHRIRLDVTSSHFPRFARNLNTGGDIATECKPLIVRQRIFHSTECPSALILPVVPR